MPDVAANKTEELLGRTERKLDRIYKQAAKETKEKYIAYIEKYKKELAVKQAELASGKITDEQYQNWIQRKMFSGRKYQEMARTLAEDLTMTNQKAMSIVNGFLPEAYAMNYNFMAYQMDVAGVPMGASYTLYDRHVVEKLVRERKVLLPKPRVDIPKDQKWNVTHIKNAITQGVLQGESIQHISKRLEKVVGMNKASAYRNARTAMTGAQNGGRVDRMKDAQKRGINVWKEWCTTHDGRARESHLDIDGERVPPDATFSNGCVYPGDPVGDPAEVYNCRCTLLPWLPDYDFDRREVERGIDSVSYDEWKDEHMQSQPVGIESLRQIAEQSTDKYDFWTNLDENQQSLFKASGMKLDDAFNQLHSGASLPEWKAPAPGGPESFAVNIDASASTLKFNPIPARSKGWMADATDLGVINVRKDGLGDSWEFIISHEAGHQISNMSSELQQIIITNPGNVLGRYNTRLMAFDGIYGEYNPEEAFATGVSNFVRHPESMKRTYPEAYQAFNTLFTTSPSALEYVIQSMQRYKREFLL